MTDEIRRTLQESLGVTIVTEWWNACCAFLLQGQGGPVPVTVTADAVLAHLLVSDLRDVVRSGNGECGEDVTGSSSSSSSSTAARQLHLALERSTHSNSCKQELSSDFRLLCQLEEVVDVSLNAETRLARASASGSSCPALATQKRCLKFLLSDGYQDDLSSPIVGMEVLPLPFHNQTSLPLPVGAKFIIQGPLTIRWGILQLHSGNTTIVGGRVEELVEKHNKALEQAQRTGGVGVDATIRALIGTNAALEDEDNINNDEGEGESGDVPAAATATVVPVAAVAAVDISTAAARAPMHSPNANTNPYSHNSNSNSISIRGRGTGNNPPAQTHPTSMTTRITTTTPLSTTGNDGVSRILQSQPSARNPYTSSSTGSATTNATVATTSTSTSTSTSTTAIANGARPYPQPPVRTNANSTVATTTTTINPYSATISLSSTAILRTSFEELRNLLTQLVQNRTLYETYYHNKTAFQIDLIQKGGSLHFNIGKEKNKPNSSNNNNNNKKKQYTFEIHATFGVQQQQQQQVLSCKLPSNLVEPYFEKSPCELRALSRTDRQASSRIVDVGGRRIRQVFFDSLKTWKATLCPSPEQVFETGDASGTMELDNVMTPILVLEPIP